MVNRCGECSKDTGSDSVYWCSPECYHKSYKQYAQAEYERLLALGLYQSADWWRMSYNLPSLADRYING